MLVTVIDSIQSEGSWLPCSEKRVIKNRKQFGNNSTLGKSNVVVNDVVPTLCAAIWISMLSSWPFDHSSSANMTRSFAINCLLGMGLQQRSLETDRTQNKQCLFGTPSHGMILDSFAGRGRITVSGRLHGAEVHTGFISAPQLPTSRHALHSQRAQQPWQPRQRD